jgi:hypothetical protein
MKNYADRWLRGFGFANRVCCAQWVAFGPLFILAWLATDSASMPDWLWIGIYLTAAGYAFVFGPAIFDWMAGKLGIVWHSALIATGEDGRSPEASHLTDADSKALVEPSVRPRS